MGICSTNGSRMTASVRYGDGYELLPDHMLLEWHHEVKTALMSEDRGAALVTSIFGAEIVDDMCKKDYLRLIPNAAPSAVELDVAPPPPVRPRDEQDTDLEPPPAHRTRFR